jgi:FkbM family methyltransferase
MVQGSSMTFSAFKQRANYFLRRRGQILSCPHLGLGIRLGTVLSRSANPVAAIRQMVRLEGDKLTVAIDGFSFAIPAPDEPDEQRFWRIESFSQVIAETFVFPVLFGGAVQLRPGDVALDLGGNIGSTAALFSRIVGPAGKVYAFEPGVDDILRRHVEANGLANVEVLPQAVGDAPGDVTLNVGMLGLGMDSSIAYKKDWHTTGKVVPMDTLDHFAEARGLERVDYVKMDIEGAEEPALRGALALIKRFRPKWSISSYHNDFSGERQHPKLVALLKSVGYTVDEIPYYHIYAY